MLDYTHLATLRAIEEEGTFEGAARALGVSSFGVSQRIKQLEKSLGVILVERGPTRISEVGKILCGHTRDVATLEDAIIDKHRIDSTFGEDGAPVFKIAIPEEYISGWLCKVIEKLSEKNNPPGFEISIADPVHSAELMQSGSVVAAVSSAREPIHGFKSFTLGEMWYLAVANPDFADRHFSKGVTLDSIREALCLRFCPSDSLATEWVEVQFEKRPGLSLYNCPGSTALLHSVLSGHAWSMMPTTIAGTYLTDASLVELRPGNPLIRPLFWHVSIAMVPAMSDITRTITTMAIESG